MEFLKKRHRAFVFRVKGKDKDMTTAFGKMFARLLASVDLQFDTRNGKQRTMYSLRHYYATMALTYNRTTVYNLARHQRCHDWVVLWACGATQAGT